MAIVSTSPDGPAVVHVGIGNKEFSLTEDSPEYITSDPEILSLARISPELSVREEDEPPAEPVIEADPEPDPAPNAFAYGTVA